ncbi:outer membrane lipoprotein carrier protein LolA [Fodinicurvata sp. EGI_FJ10296]|jgi:outer membrane lipoprotein-sorting protein|uniref:LolA family protein n=1 Tax=Fodinicurvata sp. EGI_FJ10296 TaxID=3231908 RepID=UPI0034527BE2
MMTRRFLTLAGTAAAFALAPGLTATGASADGWSNPDAIVSEVESYLQGIRSLRATFIQQTDRGGYAEGEFYLDRPGRMRIEYEDAPDLIIANGTFITYYDLELGQRSDQFLSSSLAGFIAREQISLSGDVTVRDVSTEFDVIRIDVVQTEEPSAGELSLVFDRDPIELKGWLVHDAQGVTTEITLEDLETDISLSSSLFQTPERFR